MTPNITPTTSSADLLEPTREAWQDIAIRKRATRDSLIPRQWRLPEHLALSISQGGPRDVLDIPSRSGIMTEEELKMTEMDGAELLISLAQSKIKKIMFEDALKRADELDAILERTGKPMGPLHGLPVSLKDAFQIKGLDSTIGMVYWCEKPDDRSSALTDILLSLGAVLYVKTTTPPALFLCETYSYVWGITTMPHNRLLSPGGSSGGEAALIAMRGSPLGFGSDIACSVRQPAAWCGIFGLLPSPGRLSHLDFKDPQAGMVAVRDVSGPLASSIKGIEALVRAIVGASNWEDVDPDLPSKLRFAVLYDDLQVKPDPPTQRGLREAVQALEKAGHEVIKWPHDVEHWKEGCRLHSSLTGFDGGQTITDLVHESGEPWAPNARIPDDWGTGGTPEYLYDLQIKQAKWKTHLLHMWNSTRDLTSGGKPVDGWLLPVDASCSARHQKCSGYTGYTAVFNIAEYTSISIPVTSASSKIDFRDESHIPRNEIDRQVWEQYDPEMCNGARVGMQLVGKRLEEEKVIEMAKVVVAALNAARGLTTILSEVAEMIDMRCHDEWSPVRTSHCNTIL